MLISDLLPFLYQNQLPMPLGGPAAALLPKSANNATGGNIPGVRTPPLSSPTDMMNAGTHAQNVQSEIKLRDLQGQQTGALIDLIKQAGQPAPPMYLDSAPGNAGAAGTGSLSFAPSQSGDMPGQAVASPGIDEVTAGDEPEWRALAQAIAGPESRGKFNIRYTPKGGAEFGDYTKHPNIPEPGPAGPSTAAGAWQITHSTWNGVPEELRPDFAPPTQYSAFKWIADKAYAAATGRDVLSDLRAGKLDDVKRGLQGTWPTIGKAMAAYPSLLQNYSRSGTQVADSAPAQSSIPELPDTSLAGSRGTFASMFGGSATPTGSGFATALQPPALPQVQGTGMFGSAPPFSLVGPSYAPQAPQGNGMVTVRDAAGTYNVPQAEFDRAASSGTPYPGKPLQLAQNGPLSSLPTTQAPPMPMGAPSPAAVAPRMMPGGAPAFGPMPPQMPQQGGGTGLPRLNPQYLGWALQRDQVNAALGRRNPTALEETLKMALSNSPQFQAAVEAAKKNATAPIDLRYAGPMASAQAWGKAPADIYTAWNKPVNARPGGAVMNPVTGQMTGAVPTLQKVVDPATGQERWQYMSPMGPQASNAPGGIGGSPGIAGLGPGERQSLVTRAEKEQGDRQRVITEGDAAGQQRATLLNMANEAGRFYQGPGAPQYQQAARYLRTIFPSFDGQVASYEDFVKNAGNLTRQAVRETSSRAAVQEFQLIGNTLPSVEMSPRGLQRVQNELIGLTDYRLAKSQAQQAWETAHGGPGNVTNFETTFQRQASPYAFVVARMDAPDRQEMFAKLQGSAQGRQELARLGQQLQYLKQSGLAQ